MFFRVEVVVFGILHEKVVEMIESAENLVGASFQFLGVEVHRVDGGAFPQEVETADVC